MFDWGTLLSLITDDLDKSIKELKELRHEILDLRQGTSRWLNRSKRRRMADLRVSQISSGPSIWR